MARRLQELRTELTKWEAEFALACNRKPDMRDASARPEIAAKYKEVESLKRALEPPPPPPPSPVRKKSAFGFTVASRLIQDPKTGQLFLKNPSTKQNNLQNSTKEKTQQNKTTNNGENPLLGIVAKTPTKDSAPNLGDRAPSSQLGTAEPKTATASVSPEPHSSVQSVPCANSFASKSTSNLFRSNSWGQVTRMKTKNSRNGGDIGCTPPSNWHHHGPRAEESPFGAEFSRSFQIFASLL